MAMPSFKNLDARDDGTVVAAVVVTFNPDKNSLENNLATYKDQVSHVIIVDNSDNDHCQRFVADTTASLDGVMLIQFNYNRGIAAAQNAGLELAHKLNAHFIVEVDQDTALPVGYIASALAAYRELAAARPILGVGPASQSTREILRFNDATSCSFKYAQATKSLSSGFFYSIKACDLIGPKNEQLFIDLVDWEWCWRARRHGLPVYLISTLRTTHCRGFGHAKFFGFTLGLSAPRREYYQVRNILALMLKGPMPIIYRACAPFYLGLRLMLIIFVHDCKTDRITYFIRGLRDFRKISPSSYRSAPLRHGVNTQPIIKFTQQLLRRITRMAK